MIFALIETLIDYAIKKELIADCDVYVVRNELMRALKLSDFTKENAKYSGESIDELLEGITSYAVSEGIIADTASSRDLFDTEIMGILTPMPREIMAKFSELYAKSPKDATDWYYKTCADVNYVRASRIAKDLRWTHETEYGTLDVTVNLSKPEKDPRDIALARTQRSASYPRCQLCAENAGFAGTLTHPARQNLRPIGIKVGGGDWFMQYSPYGYYNEHCIVFNSEHIPMKIDSEVFGKLFDILDIFPHYFVGSNADLPIVGGSILSHEHFQGGGYSFAMERADIETEFSLSEYPSVKAGILKWPMSVIRLSSTNRAELALACERIHSAWRGYTDSEVFIFAETDGTPHNTVTPIARKRGDLYECDIVLRNNITTEDRPLGVYHPAPSLHHIKKENIGLIEVMGLAVLPSRLKGELDELERVMVSGESVRDNKKISHHADWADEIMARYPELSKDNARNILLSEVGEVFLKVLCDAGVFKRTEEGRLAFLRFIDSVNGKIKNK